MSRAFVKDADEEVEKLPDRLISPHPNFVTAEGLKQIEAAVARLAQAYAEAQAAGDREAIGATSRDLRYWTARRASAELVEPPKDGHEAHFGSTVTIARKDGREQTYRIVGEDEADPAHGTLSYVSPLAKALMGKAVGDVVRLPNGEAKVVKVS